MAKTVTLKQVGYRCSGTAVVSCWFGGQGTIDMDSWDTKNKSKKSVVKGVNDGQFGCESIESAIIYLDELYENDYTVHIDTIEVKSDRLKKAKRGI